MIDVLSGLRPNPSRIANNRRGASDVAIVAVPLARLIAECLLNSPPPALLQSNPRSVAAKLADRSSCKLTAATAGGSAASGSAAGDSGSAAATGGDSGSAAAATQRAAPKRCDGGGPAGGFPRRGGGVCLGAFGDGGATEGTGPFRIDTGAIESTGPFGDRRDGIGRGRIGSVSVTVISEAFRFMMGRGAFFSSMMGWGAFLFSLDLKT